MRRTLISLLCAGALVLAAAACGDDADSAGEPAPDTSAAPPPSTSAPATSGGPTDVTDVTSEYLEPGTYFVDADQDPETPLRVVFEVADEGWSPLLGTVKFTPTDFLGLTISTATNVVTDGCLDHRPAEPEVGPTVDDLATALSGLAPFETTAPESTTVDDHEGQRVTLTAPDIEVDTSEGTSEFACAEGNLASWIGPGLHEYFNRDYFNGYNGEPGTSEDIRIVDVDGTRLLISAVVSPRSSAEDVAELDAIVDSIQIEP